MSELKLRFVPYNGKVKPVTWFYGISKNGRRFITVREAKITEENIARWVKELESRGIKTVCYRTYLKQFGKKAIAVKREDSPTTLFIAEDGKPYIPANTRIDRKVSTFLRYALYYLGAKLSYKTWR